jgi:hypothetical protein
MADRTRDAASDRFADADIDADVLLAVAVASMSSLS